MQIYKSILHGLILMIVILITIAIIGILSAAYAENFSMPIYIKVHHHYANFQDKYYKVQLHIVKVFPNEVLNNPLFSGDTVRAMKWKGQIWILEDTMLGVPKYGGCSFLWHEILHYKFWTHDDMRLKASNFDCYVW